MTVNRVTAGVGVVALVLGVTLLIAAGGLALWVAGVALLGLSGIEFVPLVFLLVGQSERGDRLRKPPRLTAASAERGARFTVEQPSRRREKGSWSL